MNPDQKTKIVSDITSAINPIVTDLQKLVEDVVKAVELYQASIAPLSGSDKQEIATSVISGFVKLPFPFSLVQNLLLKLVVNYAVHKLNSSGTMPMVPPTDSTDSSLGENSNG